MMRETKATSILSVRLLASSQYLSLDPDLAVAVSQELVARLYR
jgi:hypothetical protein